jgi:hypothetical protein
MGILGGWGMGGGGMICFSSVSYGLIWKYFTAFHSVRESRARPLVPRFHNEPFPFGHKIASGRCAAPIPALR